MHELLISNKKNSTTKNAEIKKSHEQSAHGFLS